MYTLFICESYHTRTKSFQSTEAAIAFFNQLEISAQNIDVAYIDSINLPSPIVLQGA